MHLDSNGKKNRRKIGFAHAWNGIQEVIRRERNFQIHLFVAFIVICVSFLLSLTAVEWAIIVVVIGFVLVAEMLNTAIEELLNYLKPDIHPTAKLIKDIAAGAVLVASFVAVMTGFLIFLPKLFGLL